MFAINTLICDRLGLKLKEKVLTPSNYTNFVDQLCEKL